MISEGNPAKISEATKMFKNVALGIIFIMAAWLIVTLITNSLLEKKIDYFTETFLEIT